MTHIELIKNVADRMMTFMALLFFYNWF